MSMSSAMRKRATIRWSPSISRIFGQNARRQGWSRLRRCGGSDIDGDRDEEKRTKNNRKCFSEIYLPAGRRGADVASDPGLHLYRAGGVWGGASGQLCGALAQWNGGRDPDGFGSHREHDTSGVHLRSLQDRWKLAVRYVFRGAKGSGLGALWKKWCLYRWQWVPAFPGTG